MPTPASPDVSTLSFEDDGSTPNNPSLPALLYRGALDDTGDLAEAFETFFKDNEWQGMWRWGIYPFLSLHCP